MATSTTTSSLSNVIHNLKEVCQKVAGLASNPSDQMRALLSGEANGGIDLIPYYLDTFLPAFTDAQKSIISKSAVEAKKYKKQAEMYLSLVGIRSSTLTTFTTVTSKSTLSTTTSEKDDVDESEHPDKQNITKQAFTFVNRAIRWAPPTENHLLQELYCLRSNLHYIFNDFTSALVDIDRALQLRPAGSISSTISSWCTERKVDLLKRLGRHRDAYVFLEAELEKKVAKLSKGSSQRKHSQQQLEVKKLRQLKAELKAYKPKASSETVSATATSQTEPPSQVKSPSVLIELHPSVDLYRDPFHRRMGIKAVKSLGTFETIVCEQPVLTVLEASNGAQHIYCAYCFTDCTNTFVPCTGCQDLVYCSQNCAQVDSLQDHLKGECSGVRGLLNSHLSSAALHSFRFLARQDLTDEQLVKEGKKGVFTEAPVKKKLPSAKKMTETLKSCGHHHDRGKVQKLFVETQVELRSRLLEKMSTTVLSGAQLANALLQWLFYVAVKGADQASEKLLKEAQGDTYVTLLLHFAAEQKKVEMTQFGWHTEENAADDGVSSTSSSSSSGSAIQQASFQCLLGSLVGPGCMPNAEWTFDSSSQRFYIRTLRPVSKGEPISIPYLDLTGIDFFQRQALLTEHFLISCPCSLCFSQSAHHFALRCTVCNGPVPFDSQLLPEGRCLRCNEKIPSSKAAADVLADLAVINSTVSLLDGVGGASSVITKSQIHYLESKLSKLTTLVDLHNRQLQKCIIGLSGEYIRREQYSSAIAWYQWFVNTVKVHLFEAEEGVEDPFVSFNVVSKWADAYVGFIDHFMNAAEDDDEGDQPKYSNGGKKRKKSSSLVKIHSSHLSTAKYLFKRLFTLLEQLDNSGQMVEYNQVVIEREQYEALIESVKQNAKKQYNRFKSLRRKVRRGNDNCNYTLSTLSNYSSDGEVTPIQSKSPGERNSLN